MNTYFFPSNKKILSSGYILCRSFTIFNIRKAETHFIHCPWAGPHGLRLASGAWAFAQDCDLRWRVVDRWWRWGDFWKTKICWKFLNLPALKLTFSHLKIDSWNTIVSFWDPAYFQGRTVSFRQGRFFLMNFHNILWLIVNKNLPRSFRFEETSNPLCSCNASKSSNDHETLTLRKGRGRCRMRHGLSMTLIVDDAFNWKPIRSPNIATFSLNTWDFIFGGPVLGHVAMPNASYHLYSGFYFWIGCPGTIPPKSFSLEEQIMNPHDLGLGSSVHCWQPEPVCTFLGWHNLKKWQNSTSF